MAILAACNGDGSGAGGSSVPVQTGIFEDGKVTGLFYKAEDGSPQGLTDSGGKFQYHENDKIAFYVGEDQNGIQLGRAVKATDRLTPKELIPGTSEQDEQTRGNIIRFLQSLDDDDNPDNGIVITQSMRKAAQGHSLAFNVSETDFEISIKDFMVAINKYLVLSQSAHGHFISVQQAAAERNLPHSLHATGHGMREWFEAPDGIGKLIGITFDELGCSAQCHVVPSEANDNNACAVCHEPSGSEVHVKAKDPNTCISCHGRQGLERNKEQLAMMGMEENTDVHTSAGMVCSDCHTFNEMHGHEAEYTSYTSLNQKGHMERDCESCHKSVHKTTPEHAKHLDDIQCSSCHMQTVTTCYNCHLDSSREAQNQVMLRPFQGFVLLANDETDGKITTATYQTFVSGNHTFAVFAPYHNHAIQEKGRTCGDCHDNPYVRELKDTNRIMLTSFSGEQVTHALGIIPFVPDKFSFQFMDHELPAEGSYNAMSNPGKWTPMQTVTPERFQYRFIKPLTSKQLEALGKSEH